MEKQQGSDDLEQNTQRNTKNKDPNMNQNLDQNSTNVLESVDVNSLESDKSFLLKVCTGDVQPEQAREWLLKHGITSEDSNDVLSDLVESFEYGKMMAENMDMKFFHQHEDVQSIKDEIAKDTYNKVEIIEKLNNIVQQIDGIRMEVTTLLTQFLYNIDNP